MAVAADSHRDFLIPARLACDKDTEPFRYRMNCVYSFLYGMIIAHFPPLVKYENEKSGYNGDEMLRCRRGKYSQGDARLNAAGDPHLLTAQLTPHL